MQKYKLKNISIKLTTLLCVVALASFGCGSGGGTAAAPVTIKFWKTFADSSEMQGMISAYQQLHPNVTIEYTKKNCTDATCTEYQADVLNALASGDGPDIFSIHNSWLPQYQDKLTPAPDKSFTLRNFKDTFVDTVVQDFTKDEKIYGTALSVDSLGLYYNKDLLGSAGLATPPKTWDELARYSRVLKQTDKKTGYIKRSGVAIGTSANVYRAQDIIYLLMLQKGVVPWSQDHLNPSFADAQSRGVEFYNPGVEAFQFYTSFARPGNDNYNWNVQSDQSLDAFVNGRAAFVYGYAFNRDTIVQKNPNLNFDVTDVPQPNLDDPAVNFANYWGEVVSKQSKNANWAWDFLKFISSKDQLDKYYATIKLPSSRKDLIDVQIKDPELGVFAHANLTAKPFFRPDEAKMDAIIRAAIDSVILRGSTPEDALHEAQQQAAALVRQSF